MHATIHAVPPLVPQIQQSESGNCILDECVASSCLHVPPPPPPHKACVIVSIIISLNLVTVKGHSVEKWSWQVFSRSFSHLCLHALPVTYSTPMDAPERNGQS